MMGGMLIIACDWTAVATFVLGSLWAIPAYYYGKVDGIKHAQADHPTYTVTIEGNHSMRSADGGAGK